MIALPPAPVVQCVEDAPCWNWATMGNLHRGITTRSGKRLVVGPCTFRLFTRSGNVDHRVTVTLRGDTTAMHFRCMS